MNLWTSVFLILGALFAFIIKIFPVLVDHPWLKLLFIISITSALVSRLFFMKDGVILKMNGALPKIVERREMDSKWNKYLMAIFNISIILFVIGMFVLFLQSEALRVQQQVGSAQ